MMYVNSVGFFFLQDKDFISCVILVNLEEIKKRFLVLTFVFRSGFFFFFSKICDYISLLKKAA